MKKILRTGVAFTVLIMTGSAMAADLRVRTPPKKAPVVAVPMFSWTGCYIGAHVGGAWGKKDWLHTEDNLVAVSPPEPFGSHNVSGVLGGGQVGCDYQAGAWVFGVEGDFAWTGVKGDHSPFADDFLQSKVAWMTTVTGRVGYAWDRALLYVKGGGAWARDKFTEVFSGDAYTASQTRGGWTVGGGLEYAFAGNWSAKIEYNFADLGDKFARLENPALGSFGYDIDQHLHVVKFGLNYRFGYAPAGSRY